jgi:hypothetical protein
VSEIASAETYVKLLGTLYRPSLRGEVKGRISGWGWSGSESSRRRKPSHLGVQYTVGTRGESIGVDLRQDRIGTDFHSVHHVVWSALNGHRRGNVWRFPIQITIERDSMAILVDGQPVSFTVIKCGKVAIAAAELDGRTVSVDCSLARLGRLRLESIPREEFDVLIREWHASHKQRPQRPQRRR